MSQNSTLSRDTGEATTVTPPGKVSIVLNYSNRSLLSKSHVLNSILFYKDTIAYREQEMKEGMARYLDVLIRNSNLPCVKPCQHGRKIRQDQNKCHLEEVWFPFARTSSAEEGVVTNCSPYGWHQVMGLTVEESLSLTSALMTGRRTYDQCFKEYFHYIETDYILLERYPLIRQWIGDIHVHVKQYGRNRDRWIAFSFDEAISSTTPKDELDQRNLPRWLGYSICVFCIEYSTDNLSTDTK